MAGKGKSYDDLYREIVEDFDYDALDITDAGDFADFLMDKLPNASPGLRDELENVRASTILDVPTGVTQEFLRTSQVRVQQVFRDVRTGRFISRAEALQRLR